MKKLYIILKYYGFDKQKNTDLLSSHLSKIEIPNNKKILKEKSFLKKKAGKIKVHLLQIRTKNS